MLELTSFQAEILKLDVVLVSWRIAPTDEGIGKFRFLVGRSNSPGGPFDVISPQLVNLFQFFDITRQMKSHFRKFYYRLTITDVSTGQSLDGPVTGLEAEPDLFLLEIRRRTDLYLRRFVGVPAAVLIAKTFGQRCPDCFDQVKMRQTSSQCRMCFNTGFVGGYFPQVNTFISFSPNPEMVQLLETGERHGVQTNMWMSHFPLLSPRDMIVEFPLMRRWRVVSTGRTERLRAVSRQISQLVEITRSDIEYEVPVQRFLPPPETFIGFRPPDGSALL